MDVKRHVERHLAKQAGIKPQPHTIEDAIQFTKDIATGLGTYGVAYFIIGVGILIIAAAFGV
jgi:hypothetical protein